MAYIRVNKHFLHLPYLVLAAIEFLLLYGVAWCGEQLLSGGKSGLALVAQSLSFALLMSASSLAMGVYPAMVKEGLSSMVLRTVVSLFLLGSSAAMVLNFVFPSFYNDHSDLLIVVVISFAALCIVRGLFLKLVDGEQLKRRVIIFGAGEKAQSVLNEFSSVGKGHKVHLVGCVVASNSQIHVDQSHIVATPDNWADYVRRENISEIVIAPDERRAIQGAQFPLGEFLDCKLAGVTVTDALGFCERELGKIDIDLLSPSWMVYSDGFKYSRMRNFAKRVFDVGISLVFLAVLWPFMLLTALAVLFDGGRPVLYSQERVGINGKIFRIYKFRSMRQDAEKEGKAVWASKNDSRVTKVGAFIRNTRLDELPQLYNVIVGDMSFVGPRPERPQFVEQLNEQVPFYATRHKVTPGLMGWAQLNYPYGASVEDARGKLEYDLYYTKNHSFFMDLLIMIQTVEIVLLGKGVH